MSLDHWMSFYFRNCQADLSRKKDKRKNPNNFEINLDQAGHSEVKQLCSSCPVVWTYSKRWLPSSSHALDAKGDPWLGWWIKQSYRQQLLTEKIFFSIKPPLQAFYKPYRACIFYNSCWLVLFIRVVPVAAARKANRIKTSQKEHIDQTNDLRWYFWFETLDTAFSSASAENHLWHL